MTIDNFNVGVIGFGTIGGGVVRILQKDKALLKARAGIGVTLTTVADIAPQRKEGIDYDGFEMISDASALVTDEKIHIVVELIGGVSPARSFIETALKNRKHVVTANKELMAKHGKALIALAKENGVNLFYEASSGGGIPIINALTSALAANRYQKIYGILNGTTNYILTKMFYEGADFEAVLEEAQDLGYAEADPSSDVEGHDVAYKLAILGSIAFNCYFENEDVYREGITRISARDIDVAKKYGYVIKLVATGIAHGNEAVELRVHPVMVKGDHPLASVNGSFNAVYVEGENVGETMFYGRGAGELPTASAIVGDIVTILRGAESKTSSPTLNFGEETRRVIPMGDIESKYYLRLTVADRAGVLAAITKSFGDHKVSIRTVEQTDHPGASNAELVMTTHIVKEAQIQEAIREIEKLDSVEEVCSLIRIDL